jgi:hypothetical protein
VDAAELAFCRKVKNATPRTLRVPNPANRLLDGVLRVLSRLRAGQGGDRVASRRARIVSRGDNFRRDLAKDLRAATTRSNCAIELTVR